MKLCLPMKARSLAHSQLSRRRAVPGGWLGAGGDILRWPWAPARLLSPRLSQAFPKHGEVGRGWVAFGLGLGAVLGNCKHILKI